MAEPAVPGGALLERGLAWACRQRLTIAGVNPLELALRTVRSSIEDRVSGLAAEMAFFALLSLVPLVVAFGATLGYLSRLIGEDRVERAEEAIISSLTIVFNPRSTEEFLAPFVRAMLGQERGGVALGGLALTLYLASRVFSATIRSLDLAYRVSERRSLLAQRLTALGFAVGFILVVPVIFTMMVVGPLLGTGEELAERLDVGLFFEILWTVMRWPLLVLLVLTFLTCVYRFGPNVRATLAGSVPGAVLGLALWLLATLGLRLYLAAGGQDGRVVTEDAAVGLVARVVGALVATVLWTYLTGVAILVGGELNAGLRRQTGEPDPCDAGS